MLPDLKEKKKSVTAHSTKSPCAFVELKIYRDFTSQWPGHYCPGWQKAEQSVLVMSLTAAAALCDACESEPYISFQALCNPQVECERTLSHSKHCLWSTCFICKT